MKNLIIKRDNLNKLLILQIIFLSIISYEIHLYEKAYSILNVLILFSSIILVLLNTIGRKNLLSNYINSVKNNLLVVILTLLLVSSNMFSAIKIGYLNFSGLVGLVSVIVSIYVLYLLLPVIVYRYIESVVKLLIVVITFLSIIGIMIGIRGSFYIYSYDGMRSASILFDANYFASLASIAFLLCLKYKNIKGYILAIINLIAIYFTGSRTAILAIIITMIFSVLYYNKFSIKKIALITIFLIISYSGMNYLYRVGFFRIYQGLAGREALWSLSIEYILKEPVWGYGYGQIRTVLGQGGIYRGASSHNYLLDYALMFGLPALMVNLLVIIIGFYRGLRNNTPPYIIQIVVYLLISMNSIVLSLGGVGAASLVFTIFLGIANNYKRIILIDKGDMYD